MLRHQPFEEDPGELSARVIRGSLRRTTVFRDRRNLWLFPDDLLNERYRFSFEALAFLSNLLGPYVYNVQLTFSLHIEESLGNVLFFKEGHS